MTIEVLEADITGLRVDAVVNAANESLLGGGGVDGAIHRAAGPGLLSECRAIPQARPGVRCPTGEARLTGGHRLPARHVIHTVGPVWRGGAAGEAELLAACYRACLSLAARNGLDAIAFPAISCGAYGYPPERAVPLAVREACAWQEANPRPRQMVFACSSPAMAERYRAELAGRPERRGTGSA